MEEGCWVVEKNACGVFPFPKRRRPEPRKNDHRDLMLTEAVDNFVDKLESPSAIRPAVLLLSELPFS